VSFQPPEHLGDPVPADLRAAIDRVRERSVPFGAPLVYFAETGSTNDVVAQLATQGAPEGTLVVAASQTSGRGRHGRQWFSPPGSGAYFSVLFRPDRDSGARAASLLTIAAGVAACEGIERAAGVHAQIKWPNDLVAEPGRSDRMDRRGAGESRAAAGRRKLAGILAEGSVSGGALQYVVLGIGINVGDASYPPDLSDRVTSLSREGGRDVPVGDVIAECVAALASRWRGMNEGSYDEVLYEWRRRSPSAIGAAVQVMRDGKPVHGMTRGLDDNGALMLDVDGSLSSVVAGEVVWL
jgi:BirA family biotin operon repressor/biotin-[acetyl-CoA-carboxylase] ligase